MSDKFACTIVLYQHIEMIGSLLTKLEFTRADFSNYPVHNLEVVTSILQELIDISDKQKFLPNVDWIEHSCIFNPSAFDFQPSSPPPVSSLRLIKS